MKRKSLIFVLVLLLVMSISITLTACDGLGPDYKFTIEGIEGYSDANISPKDQTIDFVVKETSVVALPFSVVKLPSDATMKVYEDKEKTKELKEFDLKEGLNVFYIDFTYVNGEESISMLWTMSVTKLTKDSNIDRIEDFDMVKTYKQFEKYKPGKIRVVLENTAEYLKVVDQDMLQGFSTNTAGKRSVLITYQEKTCKYEINVVAPEVTVTKIEIAEFDRDYLINDKFKTATLNVTKSNGTTSKVVVNQDMLEGFDTSTVGEKVVKVNYQGQNTTFTIVVKEPVVVENIKVSSVAKEYLIGSAFTCGTIIATYSDNTTKNINVTKDMLTGFDTTTLGNKIVTITYEGKTCTFEMSVVEKKDLVSKIEVVSFQENYFVGEDFVEAIIAVTYADNKTANINVTKEMLSGFDTSTVGNKLVTINYKDKSTVFTICVKEKVIVTDFTINSVNDIYALNEDFKGGTLTVQYSDKSKNNVDLTKEMLTGFNTAKTGSKIITVDYENIKKEFTIQVVDSYVVDIATIELRYLSDATDIVATLNESINGVGNEIVVTKDMVTGFEPGKIGTQLITITYKEFIFNVEVKVMKKEADVVTPIKPTTFDEANLYNVAAKFYCTVILSEDSTSPAGQKIIENRINFYKANKNTAPFPDLVKALSQAGITNESFVQRKIDVVFNDFVDVVASISLSVKEFGMGANPMDILNAALSENNVNNIYKFANGLVETFTPVEIATFIQNIGGLVIQRAGVNEENLQGYYESIKDSPIFQIFMNQGDAYKNTIDFFKVLSLSDMTYVVDSFVNVIKGIVSIEQIKVTQFVQFISTLVEAGPNAIGMLLSPDPDPSTPQPENPNLITSQELVNHLGFVGELLNTFKVGFDGRINLLKQIASVVARDAYYSHEYRVFNPIELVSELVLNAVDNLDGIIFLLQNITVEDVSTLRNSIMQVMSVEVPAPFTPDETKTEEENRLAEEEYNKQLEIATNKKNKNTVELIVDATKIIKVNLDTMTNFEKDTILNFVSVFLKAMILQDIEFNKVEIESFINSTSVIDKTTLDEAKVNEVLQSFGNIINPIMEAMQSMNNQSSLTLRKRSEKNPIYTDSIVYIKSGTTLEEFKNILDENFVVNYGVASQSNQEGNNLEITFNKDLTFNDNLDLITEGCHIATISYNGTSASFRYYIFDETTKNRISNYFLMTDAFFIGNDRNVIVYDLNKKLPRLEMYGEPIINLNIEACLKGTQVNYKKNERYNFIDIIDGRIPNVRIDGVTTDQVKLGYASVIIIDDIVGEIYIPFKYAVIDPDKRTLTNTYLTLDGYSEYFVYDYYTSGIDQKLKENNLLKYKDSFIPNLKLIEEYDYGFDYNIIEIPSDQSDKIIFENAKPGINTFKYTHTDGKIYTIDLIGVSFAESRVILPENVNIPEPNSFYEDKKLREARYNRIYGTFVNATFNTNEFDFATYDPFKEFNPSVIFIQYENTKNNGLNGLRHYVENTDELVTTILGYKYEFVAPDLTRPGKTTLTIKIIDTLNSNKVVVEKTIPFMVYPNEDKGKLEKLEISYNQETIYAESDINDTTFIDNIFKEIYSIDYKMVLEYVVKLSNDFGHPEIANAYNWLKENYQRIFFVELPSINNPYMVFKSIVDNKILFETQIKVISDEEANTPTGIECKANRTFYEENTGFNPEDVTLKLIFGNGYREVDILADDVDVTSDADFGILGPQTVTFTYAGIIQSNPFDIEIITREEANQISNIYFYDSYLDNKNQTSWEERIIGGWYSTVYKLEKFRYKVGEEANLNIIFKQPMLIELGGGCKYLEIKEMEPFDLSLYMRDFVGFSSQDRSDAAEAIVYFFRDYAINYCYDVITRPTGIIANSQYKYYVGDTTFKGGELSIVYETGSPDTISLTQGMLKDFDCSTSGLKDVTVSYEVYVGSNDYLTTTMQIEVLEANPVTNVEYTGYERKYIVGDTNLRTENGIITVTRQDGTIEELKMTQDFAPEIDTTSVGVGEKGKFIFNGQTYTFEIEVINEIDHIELYNFDTNLYPGEDIYKHGGQIKVVYIDQTEDIIDISETTVIGYDSKIPGNQKIVIKYFNKMRIFDIVVDIYK